ncbi:sterol desaturase family protein [Bacteriovoracaceae bacterium]|nr:sterol desaturase family protein [Bacteriovoracaceae bacterium]
MNKKTDSSIRLFENDLLEAITHVHPITPLVMWSPVTCYLLWRSYTVHALSFLDFVTWFFIAILVWTFTEYTVHRFVFHYPAKSKIGKKLIFLFHGIHHDDPDDATRLVMPPVPGVILMALLWGFFQLVIPVKFMDAFMAFFIVGYLCYDYIHYATHHFPMTSPVGKYLRKFHLRHHHAKEHSKYGVSNPLWDYVFNTVTGPKKDQK